MSYLIDTKGFVVSSSGDFKFDYIDEAMSNQFNKKKVARLVLEAAVLQGRLKNIDHWCEAERWSLQSWTKKEVKQMQEFLIQRLKFCPEEIKQRERCPHAANKFSLR